MTLEVTCPHSTAGWARLPPPPHSKQLPLLMTFLFIVTLFMGFLGHFLPFSLSCPCSLAVEHPLCFLSLCQFNYFSHFKMTIPQFYRSSCLSLPVSTPTANPCRSPLLLPFGLSRLTLMHIYCIYNNFKRTDPACPPALRLKWHLSYGLVLYQITCMFVQWILNNITVSVILSFLTLH